MTDKLMAPKLPEGYRFNLSVDRDGDLLILLQKKERMLLIPYWKTLYVRHIFSRAETLTLPAVVESNMVDIAGRLILDIKAAESAKSKEEMFRIAASEMLGNYPPKKYLMED